MSVGSPVGGFELAVGEAPVSSPPCVSGAGAPAVSETGAVAGGRNPMVFGGDDGDELGPLVGSIDGVLDGELLG